MKKRWSNAVLGVLLGLAVVSAEADWKTALGNAFGKLDTAGDALDAIRGDETFKAVIAIHARYDEALQTGTFSPGLGNGLLYGTTGDVEWRGMKLSAAAQRGWVQVVTDLGADPVYGAYDTGRARYAVRLPGMIRKLCDAVLGGPNDLLAHARFAYVENSRSETSVITVGELSRWRTRRDEVVEFLCDKKATNTVSFFF